MSCPHQHPQESETEQSKIPNHTKTNQIDDDVCVSAQHIVIDPQPIPEPIQNPSKKE